MERGDPLQNEHQREGKDDLDAGSEHGTLHQSTFGAEERDDGGIERGRYFQEGDCDNEKEGGREKSSSEPLLSLQLSTPILRKQRRKD